MKLTAIFLLAACLQLAARTSGQSVTINVKNAPLKEVFREIQKQTGLNVIIKEKALENAGKVTLNVSNMPVEQVLNLCFKNEKVKYTLVDGTIVVQPSPTAAFQDVIASSEAPKQPPPIDISGRVTDPDGNPLVGANVKVKGTNQGTSTDVNGVFVLKGVDDNATIEISYVGYQTYTRKLSPSAGEGGWKPGEAIALKMDVQSMNEVVINKGYYTEKQRLSVSNVGKVTARDIANQPVNNPLLALQGRVPGLVITQNNGIPGGGITIRLQGQNSITNGSEPLIIIDGVPFPSQNLKTFQSGILGTSQNGGFGAAGNPLSNINPTDIESIEVLKDADATAIYGSRAANGAILITTKKAKKGQTTADFNVQQGWSKVGHFIDLMNSQQYLEMRREAKKNDNASISSTDYDLNGVWDSTRYTDWQKVLIGKTAKVNKYNASITGGTSNIQYLVGGTYQRENTVFPGDFADSKTSVHFNINGTSSDEDFRLQFTGNYLTGRSNLPGFDFTQYIFLAPVAPTIYNSDGTLNWAPNPTNGNSTWTNPFSQISNLYDARTTNVVSNMVLSYRVTTGLEIKTSLGYNNYTANQFIGQLITSQRPENRPNYVRSAIFSFNSSKSWIIEPQINYSKSLGKSKFNALIGNSFQQQDNNGNAIQAKGAPNDQLLKSIGSATSVAAFNGDVSQYKYVGIFGRMNYNLLDKYIINATVRRDGSSRFGDKSKFHNFGSIGAAWIFSQEGVVSKNLSFLSFGKLRGSFGTTGSDQIGNYAYLDLYSSLTAANPYQNVPSLVSNGLANPYLQWEETRKLQFGIDLGFFKDRFVITANYIRNRSSNQLLTFELPSTTGFQFIPMNFPALVQNTAWEFALNTENFRANNFKWTSNINLTIPKNKLVKFPGFENSIYGGSLILGQALEPLGITSTYRFYGMDPSNGQFLLYDKDGHSTANPDPVTDQIVRLSSLPKLYGGFQNSFEYKRVQLDFLLQFSKQEYFNFAANTNSYPGNFSVGRGNQPVTVLNRWRQPGDNADFGPYSTGFISMITGNKFLEDVSYIRLKNLSVAYSLNESLTKRIHLKICRIFMNAQNLFTITPYDGLDPENRSVSSLPPLRVISAGIQIQL